jgi:hypothetical protein
MTAEASETPGMEDAVSPPSTPPPRTSGTGVAYLLSVGAEGSVLRRMGVLSRMKTC